VNDPARVAPEAPAEAALVAWDTRIHILNNPTLWSQILIAVGIPSLLLGVLVAFVAEDAGFALMFPLIIMSVMLVIFALAGLIIDLLGGFRVRFLLTGEGVRSLSGGGARAASTAAVAAGLLAGSASVAGAGLLARSEQDVFIPWGAITRVRVNARRRIVTIRAGWLDKPIALYCTLDNFGEVMDVLRARAGAVLA
jgi:hypothetical protein